MSQSHLGWLWDIVKMAMHHLLNQVGLHCGLRTMLEWLHVRQHGSWTLLELLHAECYKIYKGTHILLLGGRGWCSMGALGPSSGTRTLVRTESELKL